MLRAAALTALAASVLACAEQDRHVRVVVDLGQEVDRPIASVGATVTLLATDAAQHQQRAELSLDRGTPIDFPADFVVLIGDLSGELSIHAAGHDAEGVTVASGAARAAVMPGGEERVLTVPVVLWPPGVQPPDAGSPDAEPPDAGSPDTGLPDGGEPSCGDLFGTAPGYELCFETDDSCGFDMDTGGADCRAACEGFGVQCLGVRANPTEGTCVEVVVDPPFDCDTDQQTQICICSRR